MATPETKYYSTAEAKKRLRQKQADTLISWHKKGWIDAIKLDNGRYLWDVDGYIARRRAVYQPKAPAIQPQG